MRKESVKIKNIRHKIYDGTTKTMYQVNEDFILIQFFKDNVVDYHKNPIEVFGKGVLNNNISAHIMRSLESMDIENHFIEKLNMREQLVQLVDIFPLQVHITNIASGRYVSEFGIEEGYVFDKPAIDFRLKNQQRNYPVVNESQILSFNWISKHELDALKSQVVRINDFLCGLFFGIGIRLVDCRLEFGRVFNGEEFVVMLADEISPDTCRLWDMETNQKLDYEYLSSDPIEGIRGYKEIIKRLKLESIVH